MNVKINYKTGSMSFPSVESRLQATYDSKFKAYMVTFSKRLKTVFRIYMIIARADFDFKKTNLIKEVDLIQLYHHVTTSRNYEDSIYDELIHFDYKDAVMLQAHIYSWLQENSYLNDQEIALLMLVIYERLFAYNLQEVYDTLQSMNPEEDDIDDYSNSTIEVYDSSEFSDCDGEFQTFISEMICCFEKAGFSTEKED